MPPERISVELTNRCSKACWFCYNHSSPAGALAWDPRELVDFVLDCAAHGVRAVSFGGGEPLQYEPLHEVLAALRGRLFRSLTTNGLLLNDDALRRLAHAAPDKVHVSIHFPGNVVEVGRVIRDVGRLSAAGVRSGVNLLVARSQLVAARSAVDALTAAGIGNDRIVYLPMRGQDTPTPAEVAAVASNRPFQSMTCLGESAASPRFCSIAADRTVAWCSYTTARRTLREPTHAGLVEALDGLGLEFCGGNEGHGKRSVALPVAGAAPSRVPDPQLRFVGLAPSGATPRRSAGRFASRAQLRIRQQAERRCLRSAGRSACQSQLQTLPSPNEPPAAKCEGAPVNFAPVPTFPAAHSMDTEWFAVDAEGRVGYFESGEPAPVPSSVAGGTHEDVLGKIFLNTPAAFVGAAGKHAVETGSETWHAMRPEPAPPPADPPAPGPWLARLFGPKPRPPPSHSAPWLGRVGMLLGGTDLLHELEKSDYAVGPPVAAPGGEMFPVWFERISGRDYRHLHDPAVAGGPAGTGACLGCVGDDQSRFAAFGLYVFAGGYPDVDQSLVDYNHPPYERLSAPAYPLLLDQLPPDLRATVALARFAAARFADAPYLQPLEHVPCQVWGGRAGETYLSGDLKAKRPVPEKPKE